MSDLSKSALRVIAAKRGATNPLWAELSSTTTHLERAALSIDHFLGLLIEKENQEGAQATNETEGRFFPLDREDAEIAANALGMCSLREEGWDLLRRLEAFLGRAER